MTLEELEKDWEEKNKKEKLPPIRYGGGCAGSACDYTRDFEDWEDFMQYGMGGVYPKNHYKIDHGD